MIKINKSQWKTYKFGDIASNISERAEPKETKLDIYVGLEHLDPDCIHIKRRGHPSAVIGTKLRVYPGDIYVLKSTVTSTKEGGFEEETRYYIDYSNGTLLKIEDSYKDPNNKEYFEINYSYVQNNGILVLNNVVTTTTNFEENTTYTTTASFSNIIINSGLSDSIFQ